MNHDSYYENGFFDSILNDNILKLLWNEILSTEWISDEEDYLYKQIPSWYKSVYTKGVASDGSNRAEYERLIAEDILLSTPKSLIDLGNLVVELPEFEFFKNYYKKHELKSIDLWNGSESIDYHYDTINGYDTLVLIYLTEQPSWQQDWGGTLSMKKQVGDKVYYEKQFTPENGRMLVINNTNPLVYHKVAPMKNTSVNRYTFSFIYNWY